MCRVQETFNWVEEEDQNRNIMSSSALQRESSAEFLSDYNPNIFKNSANNFYNLKKFTKAKFDPKTGFISKF